MSSKALTVTLAGIAVLACAAPASASIAEVSYRPASGDSRDPIPPSEDLSVRGEGDETNVLTAVEEDPQTVVVRDAGATLRAGEGCASIDAHSVRCSFRLLTRVLVEFDGGAGSDTIDLASFPELVLMDGGAGADLLRSPLEGSVADGGQGSDRLIGGPGPDMLSDSEQAERDEFDGGGGVNQVSYYNRADAITVDLAARVGGAAGEEDLLVGFTKATGGDGPDQLLGSAGRDILDGGEGADRLEGRGGDDDLDGGAVLKRTHDLIFGGAGDDRLRAAPTGRATLDGGDGNDTMGGGRGADEASGGRGADHIYTGIGRDVVDAGPGDDRIEIYGQPRRMAGRDATSSSRSSRSAARPRTAS